LAADISLTSIPQGQRKRGAPLWIAIALSLAFAVCLAAQAFPPTRVIAIAPENIGHLRGHAYAFVIPKYFLRPVFAVRGDTYEARYSSLTLLEDGKPLPSPHASQQLVETLGEGRFLHLRETELYFSTSDNSDPRANGRSYSALVSATPAKGLAGALLSLAAMAWTLLLSRRQEAFRCTDRVKVAAATGLFLAIALLWQYIILDPAPRIVDSGDGGVVASIAAAISHPDRFSTDYVFSDPRNFSFYWTITIPFVVALDRFTNDIGTAYGLLAAPLLFLQMLGFFLLGRRLTPGVGWSVALALLSVPPVFVFGGELWGNLSEPLTRSTYNALFPYVILAGLPPARAYKPFLVMLICGAGVYFHPVSAPGVAMAAWIALAVCKPAGDNWLRHAVRMALAGLVFVACAVPFAVNYAHSFPNAAGSDVSTLARSIIRENVGGQYVSVAVALDMLVSGGVNNLHGHWGWRWALWGFAVASLAIMPLRAPAALARKMLFLSVFLVGLIAASAGVSFMDQAIARALGREPVQIDLIRNIRFVVPVMLIAAVTAAAFLATWPGFQNKLRAASIGLTVFVGAQWWLGYSTPVARPLIDLLDGRQAVSNSFADASTLLKELREAASDSRTLVLPSQRQTESVELVTLAVRYAGLQPLTYVNKDMNLLSYSSSRRLYDWVKLRREISSLESADPLPVKGVLDKVLDDNAVRYVLAEPSTLSGAIIAAIEARALSVKKRGTWRLWTIR